MMRKVGPIGAAVALCTVAGGAAQAVTLDFAFGGTVTGYDKFSPDYPSFKSAVPIGASVSGNFRFDNPEYANVVTPASGSATIAGASYSLVSVDSYAGTSVNGVPVQIVNFKLDGPPLAAPDAMHEAGSLYLEIAIGNPDPFAVSPIDYPFTSIDGTYPDAGGFGGNSVFASLALNSARLSLAPVPEPASWATMVAGFALVGGGLRRRRRATPLVAAG